MRDVELLVRFLAFRNYITDYHGRMKDFLDLACERLNARWDEYEQELHGQIQAFVESTKCLIDIFGTDRVGSKRRLSVL